MKNNFLLIVTSLLLIFNSCDHQNKLADAYGNFEANELIVSSEGNGKILALNFTEGANIAKGALIAQIDTFDLHLQKQQAWAKKAAIQSKIVGINAQIEVAKQQLRNIEISYKRTLQLFEDGVATAQQKEDLEGQKSVVEKQIEASKTNIDAVIKETNVVDALIASINHQIAKQKIVSPLNGTILEKYALSGELTAMGKPILKIADLSSLKLRCYIPETYLSSIKLGDQVEVLIDHLKEKDKTFSGKISWIASKAEFTPKTIQTKEERVKLVYAIDVLVKNDGALKIGMPAEVRFADNNLN